MSWWQVVAAAVGILAACVTCFYWGEVDGQRGARERLASDRLRDVVRAEKERAASRFFDHPTFDHPTCSARSPEGWPCVKPAGHDQTGDARARLHLPMQADGYAWGGDYQSMEHWQHERPERLAP